MALVDILTDSSNLSSIMEIVALFLIVLSFFRWYDSRYAKMVESAKHDIIHQLENTRDVLEEQVRSTNKELDRLTFTMIKYDSKLEDARG